MIPLSALALAAAVAFAAPEARTPSPEARTPAAPSLAFHHQDDELLLNYLWEELTTLPPGRRPRVGLTLSGGASRGFAHVGVIANLEYAGFPIDLVTGTSMGSLVGVAYANDVPLAHMNELARTADLRQGTDLSAVKVLELFLSDHLLSTKKIEKYVHDNVGDVTFDKLKKPFACVATDIKTGEKIVFREGPVAPAVRASMNIPGIFSPVEYRHRYLVDGGVVDFIPVDIARQMGADWVLASVTEGDYTRSTLPNVLFMLEQVIDISGTIVMRTSLARADFTISPDVGRIRIYEFERAHEALDEGRLAGRKRVREAQRSLALFSIPWLKREWLK